MTAYELTDVLVALDRSERLGDNARTARWPVHVLGRRPARARRQVRLRVRVDRRELAAIFAGGFIGAVARAGLVEALPHSSAQWPWATFIVNIVGAFALGYFTTRLQERLPLSSYRRPFLGTGFCGALTTFSTMQLELLAMLDGGHIGACARLCAWRA